MENYVLIDFIQTTIDGALKGMLFALIALAFIVIYRAGRILNFAQGDFVILGGYFVLTFYSMFSLPLWLGLPAAFLCIAVMGIILERFVFRPLIGQELFSIVLVTIGLTILLQGLMIVVWSGSERPFPLIFKMQPVRFGEFLFSRSIFIGAILSTVMMAVLFFLFEKTRWGLKLSAVAEEHQVAQSLGISVKNSIAIGWIISCILSTFAAIIFLNGQSINFSAATIGLQALPVALLGGLESIWGAPVAGLIVGIGQSWAAAYLDPYTDGAMSSAFPYITMLIILLIRPQGLFGWKIIERV